MNMTRPNLFSNSQINILDLTDDAIIAILSYLSYDEVAQLRLVIFNPILAYAIIFRS